MSSNTTNSYATKGSVINMTKKEKETIEIDKELYLSLIQNPNLKKENKYFFYISRL